MDALFEKSLARFTSECKHVEHGPRLHVAQAGRTAHAVAFHQAVEDDSAHRLFREAYVRAEGLLLRVLEALARPALNSALVFSGFN